MSGQPETNAELEPTPQVGVRAIKLFDQGSFVHLLIVDTTDEVQPSVVLPIALAEELHRQLGMVILSRRSNG